MNTMSSQGYIARVEYDERDDIFVGRVLGLRGIISFHGKTVAELRREFAAAIKDYLADCSEQAISPEKPASGKLLIRVPPEVHSRALIKAQAMGKSLNQAVRDYLEQLAGGAGRDQQWSQFEARCLQSGAQLGGWHFNRDEANER